MKLYRYEVIQIAGVFARNPVTDEPTTHLQYFALIDDIDGDEIPPRLLFPIVPLLDRVDTPIPMSQLVLNTDQRRRAFGEIPKENGTLPPSGDSPS